MTSRIPPMSVVEILPLDALRRSIEDLSLVNKALQERIEHLEAAVLSSTTSGVPRVGVDRELPALDGTNAPVRCSCPCTSLVAGGTVVGAGVWLGMVSAREVGNLSANMLALLDADLRDIASRIIPRGGGLPVGHITRQLQPLLDSLAKVGLEPSYRTSGTTMQHLGNLRIGSRSRNQRLRDGMGWVRALSPVGEQNAANVWETVSQLLMFRGINLDAPGN